MKTINYAFAGLLLLAACNNNRSDNNSHHDSGTTGVTGSTTGQVPSDENNFEKEMQEYRYRINKRMDELKADIERAQRERKVERDIKKQKRYDVRINERESRRRSFQQTLDRLETQTEHGWQNFKEEVNDLFKRDRSQDTTWLAK